MMEAIEFGRDLAGSITSHYYGRIDRIFRDTDGVIKPLFEYSTTGLL